MLRRRASLSSADQAATRRVVQGIFRKVVTTQGKGLGEVLLCTQFALFPTSDRRRACDVLISWQSGGDSTRMACHCSAKVKPLQCDACTNLVCDEHARSGSQGQRV